MSNNLIRADLAAAILSETCAEARQVAIDQLERILIAAVREVKAAREAGFRAGYDAAMAEMQRLSDAERDRLAAELRATL